MKNQLLKRKAAGSLVWASAVALALLLPAERPAAAPLQQPSADNKPLSAADTDDLYQEKCALCHGADRAGKPPNFPTLIGVTTKYHDAEIATQIRKGKGRMPAFPSLTDAEVNALIAYLKTPAPTPAPGS